MDIGRAHVVDVLRVVAAALGLARADELPRLEDDPADAALPHARVFPARGAHAVHHNARHRLHAVFALAARLTFDEPRKQLAVGISHIHRLPHFLFPASLCTQGPRGPGTQKKSAADDSWVYVRQYYAEIDEAARNRMELIVPKLAKQYGVTEQLKADNQMEWVRQMNACKAQAEEIVKAELIYD